MTPSHDPSRTPLHGGAWDPTQPNTPARNEDYDYNFDTSTPSPGVSSGILCCNQILLIISEEEYLLHKQLEHLVLLHSIPVPENWTKQEFSISHTRSSALARVRASISSDNTVSSSLLASEEA